MSAVLTEEFSSLATLLASLTPLSLETDLSFIWDFVPLVWDRVQSDLIETVPTF
jgi:hypothetical protein